MLVKSLTTDNIRMKAINIHETLKSIEALASEVGDVNAPISDHRHRIISEAINLITGLERDDGPEAEDASLNSDSESNEQRYRELFDDSPVAIWVDDWSLVKQWLDAHTEVDDWRSYFQQHPGRLKKFYAKAKIVEVSKAAIVLFNEESFETLLAHSEVAEVIDEELESFLDTLIEFWNHKYTSVIETTDIDGDRKEIIIRRQTVMPPAHQESWSRVIYSLEDITERVHLEAQLRQSQKMEMVGQLTGGIAHDFNNMLAVIQGNAQLLTEGLGDASENIEAIITATHRATDLTQRLLVFSRKHRLEPKSLDLSVVVENMSDMLARSLGEIIDIKYKIDPDLWYAFADVGQVENALLNLAINAKDAMPEGGLLTIKCTNTHLDDHYIASIQEQSRVGRRANDEMSFGINLKPGDYVLLSVIDIGQGMTKEVLSHVFEPFFTTKQIGAGTGLGLSMVYSFAKQSGGHIEISSEPGKGTSVMLYLKRADQLQEAPPEDKEKPAKAPSKGGQILLLEDDDSVRTVILQMLDKLGYQIVSTSRASEAKQALAQGTSFDLILSDVILPGGSTGPEFVKQALVDYPGLKCVLMSGYASLGSEATKIPDEYRLLNKPFTMEQLADALDSTLD